MRCGSITYQAPSLVVADTYSFVSKLRKEPERVRDARGDKAARKLFQNVVFSEVAPNVG